MDTAGGICSSPAAILSAMPTASLKNILDGTFRANPECELVLFERLPPEQQEYLKDLRKEPDFYGVFCPRGEASLTMKSAPRDAALLYLTLREPGRLPEFVRAMFGAGCNQAIAQLVLDGILEIEYDGAFVSRLQAYRAIYDEAKAHAAGGLIAQLSLDAIQYAQRLEISDTIQLASRLYFYNRIPANSHWRRLFPSRESVLAYLGVQSGGPNQTAISRGWTRSGGGPANGWLHWTARKRAERRHSGFGYKLYISPKCEAIPEAFKTVAEVLATCGASHFKTGQDLYGLLRPDKIVSYFPDFESLQSAAAELARRLDGCPPHGVPFTAEMAGGGLLSWGVDPPLEEQTFGSQARESWRLWVTNRLATALLAGKASPASGVEPWQFALERLRLEDIDTDTWTPATGIWQREAAART
jgi:hypothetical protein